MKVCFWCVLVPVGSPVGVGSSGWKLGLVILVTSREGFSVLISFPTWIGNGLKVHAMDGRQKRRL